MNETIARQTPSAPIDTWAVLDFWLRRWSWLAAWTLALGIVGGVCAHLIWGRSYTSTAELVHYEPSAVDDAYKPRDMAAASLVVLLQSEGLFEKVGSQLKPQLSAKELARQLDITLDRNNDIVTVTANGAGRDATVDLVNQYSTIAIAYTQQMQREEATEADSYVTHQLSEVESELTKSRASVPAESAGVVAAIASVDDAPVPLPDDLPARIQAAREQLDELLVRYTDAHPLVREQKAKLAVLEDLERSASAQAKSKPARAQAPAAPLPSAMYGRVTPEEVAMGERLRTLESNRALLIARQRALQPFKDNPPGYFRVMVPASASRTFEHNHRLEIALCALLGAFVGLMGSAGQILLGEFMDNRVKTRADVRRVTGLPLLATLGTLSRMSPAARSDWAFRAWTALQSHLSPSPNHGMVCGITSAHSGDGRSTWVDLLARAASSCGFRVLTITARPSPEMQAELASRRPRSQAPSAPAREENDDSSVALTANVLSSPGQIVERMAAAGAPPMVNIPLPGWVWSLERRKQWLSALEAWREIENIVIFIELPPASVPESVLLAENVPNLIWLVDSGKAEADEIQGELETLRFARCNLVGAVLNREQATPVRGRFSRWVGSHAALAAALVFGLALASSHGKAQEVAAPVPAGGFGVTAPAQRAAWQEKLTLGPGDVVSLHLYGSPELTREEVPIGPDGRISYLEASDVVAAGLTVDELRDRLNDVLGQYRRSPQAYVLPVAYRSKKYYVLGSVVLKGVFPLDRPTTVVEAVARARGFETNLSNGALVESTDFSRSFLGRGGRHMPVDFERLFQHGDISQNVALEPGDYLYFPQAGARSIYVLGAVNQPGAVAYSDGTNAIAAIASRGGFTEGAWRQRILVVRGSLNHPQLFKVDVASALTGDSSNLALEAGDIVYVSDRPWLRVEDLLDRAASAFIEGAVVTWAGIHVGPKGSPVFTP